MRRLPVALQFIAALALCQCGPAKNLLKTQDHAQAKETNSEPNNQQTSDANLKKIMGSWLRSCFPAPQQDGFFEEQWLVVYEDRSFITAFEEFGQDSACHPDHHGASLEYRGVIHAGQTRESPADTFNLDILNSSSWWILHLGEWVNTYNDGLICGKDDWAPNVQFDVTQLHHCSLAAASSVVGKTNRTIAAREGDQLRLGQHELGKDGSGRAINLGDPVFVATPLPAFGNWRKSCHTMEIAALGAKAQEVEFKIDAENGFTLLVTYFPDASCKAMERTASATFWGKLTTSHCQTDNGNCQLEAETKRVSLQIADDVLARKFSEQKSCGIENWAKFAAQQLDPNCSLFSELTQEKATGSIKLDRYELKVSEISAPNPILGDYRRASFRD